MILGIDVNLVSGFNEKHSCIRNAYIPGKTVRYHWTLNTKYKYVRNKLFKLKFQKVICSNRTNKVNIGNQLVLFHHRRVHPVLHYEIENFQIYPYHMCGMEVHVHILIERVFFKWWWEFSFKINPAYVSRCVGRHISMTRATLQTYNNKLYAFCRKIDMIPHESNKLFWLISSLHRS